MKMTRRRKKMNKLLVLKILRAKMIYLKLSSQFSRIKHLNIYIIIGGFTIENI